MSPDPDPTPARTFGELRYPEYLRLGELLSLQRPLSKHHDEWLFIIAHQLFELGFRLLLVELDELKSCLERDAAREALKPARRAAVMMDIMIHQVELLETMSTLDFLEFRSELEGASGFQSAQFREVEALLGLRTRDRVPVRLEGRREAGAAYTALLTEEERERLERREREPSIEQSLLELVARSVEPQDETAYWLTDLGDLLANLPAPSALGLKSVIDAERRLSPGDAKTLESELQELVAQLGSEPQAEAAWMASLRSGSLASRVAELGASVAAEPKARLRLVAERAELLSIVPRVSVRDWALKQAEPAEPLLARLDRRARLREVYRRSNHQPGPGDSFDLFQLCETLLAFAESFSVFRYRHLLMVERMIGSRRGTGGSPGSSYLAKTVGYRIFPELWRMRTHL